MSGNAVPLPHHAAALCPARHGGSRRSLLSGTMEAAGAIPTGRWQVTDHRV